jgi:hypothetical protein
VLNPAAIKRAVILLLCMCPLYLWPVPAQSSPVGSTPGAAGDSDAGLGMEGPGISEDRSHIVDQLESVGIDDSSFFDFSGEGEAGPGAGAHDVEIFTGGLGGARTSMLGFDRGVGFDRGTRFDKGTEFDRGGAAFDRRSKADTGGGFDSVGGFDRERTLRIKEERQQPSIVFRREERVQTTPEKEDRSLTRGVGGDRVESGLTKEEPGKDALTREKVGLEQELLRSEELEIRSFRTTQTGFFVKIAMFAVALLLLLAGTLKGLIPLRFYFFLTILILILWNPMESLFISIIIGLSALLAPILG